MSLKKITLFTLVMLITGSIDSVRNLPATALFGAPLIFFFIVSALFFLIPAAFVSADLAAAWPENSGVYQWSKRAFGHKLGFLTVWLQWVNTLVWFPTMLSFIAGTFAYFFDPALANNNHYLIVFILVLFWGLTLLNLFGVEVSAKFASRCTVLGLLIPMIVIIGMAILWIVHGKPLQIPLSAKAMVPNFSGIDDWFSLTAIMTSFLGIELAAVHMVHIKEARKTFPKAMLLSVVVILLTMIIGSLAIAIIVPNNTILLNQGLMQAFTAFFNGYHVGKWLPVLTFLVLLGSIGELINWMISPARGLYQSSADGFLPPLMHKQNKYGVAKYVLLMQAVVVTLVSTAFLYMPSVNGSYWLLTDLSTELYMLMYLMMFIAAILIEVKYKERPRLMAMFRYRPLPYILSVMGIIGCLVTLVIGFLPPSGINVGGTRHYVMVFTGGLIVMILPVFLFYWYHARRAKTPGDITA